MRAIARRCLDRQYLQVVRMPGKNKSEGRIGCDFGPTQCVGYSPRVCES